MKFQGLKAAACGVILTMLMAGCGGVGGSNNQTAPPPAAPTISSFSPTSGLTGTAVTLTGTNFSGATAVTLGGKAATFSVTNATQIATSVPVGAATGKISVTTSAGTATSAANFAVGLPAPTISSFSPTSGLVGANVALTGTGFTGATSVKFNGTSATFSVTDDSHIATSVPNSATSGTISVTTPAGTATSAANFTVSVPAPTISSFSPTSGPVGANVTLTGTGFTGATSVKFNGTSATFSVTDDSHIVTSVPNSATTGTISVTTPSGTATSSASFNVSVAAGLDLTIDGLYVTQATQNYPAHDVPLVQGRSAWVRVFVLANQTNTAAPQVRVKFISGSTTNTLTINAPTGSTPLNIDTASTSSSWNAAVPAAWITTGTQVIADVDPANAIAETNKGNNQAAQTLNVRTLKTWKITLIPVKTGDGRVGVVENASRTRTQAVEFARRVWPVPDTVDVTVGSQMVSSAASLSSSGTGWSTVLNELQAKRVADGVTDRYYFGFVNVSYTSGVAGLGFVGAPVAIGWDFSSADQVVAHEVGHNFGRLHSPCGGASNPDPNYPYAGGVIGVPGWDAFAASGNLKPSADHDVMSYCSNLWVSDYTYKGVLAFRATSPLGILMAAEAQTAAAPKEGLLVWGRVQDGKMILEPAFRVAATGETVEPGPYTWEARDGQGRLLARLPFQTTAVEDLPFASEGHFAFVVPLDSALLTAIEDVRVVKDGVELMRVTSLGAARSEAALKRVRVQNLLDRKVSVEWDATANPVLMLRNARNGEVRGFLRGGYAEIEEAPDDLEVHVSDGTKSTVIPRTRLNP